MKAAVDGMTAGATITPQTCTPEEHAMIGRESWDEIRRLKEAEGLSVAELARRFDLDRKTVRRCLRGDEWRPYSRTVTRSTILTPHREFIEKRAPEVNYSARILYQELRASHGYAGSYETVKQYVSPLRASGVLADDITQTRFETPPGLQSQVDWGQALVPLGPDRIKVHFFVLTLGFSRRGFCCGYADERLGQFLDAHERAFDHFGGHTNELLYDRPRIVCAPDGRGGKVWNGTFLEFARYWGFEPRLCRPYRARTKGKVESGVKYVKRNFLPGRAFRDMVDLEEQLSSWTTGISDVRIHGTTHEKPIERFQRERDLLVPVSGQPGFSLQVRSSRIVAEDWLVSYQTNRYSVPFSLIGRTVSVEPCGDTVRIYHGNDLVAEHEQRHGKYEMSIQPEHGPGAIARNARKRQGAPGPGTRLLPDLSDVEIRDLSVYEQLAEVAL